MDEEFAMRWDPKGLGVLQEEEERVNKYIMALEANVDIMAKIVGFYCSLVENPDFPEAQRQACIDRTNRATSVLEELIYDQKTQRSRAAVLSKLITDRKDMVSQTYTQLRYLCRKTALKGLSLTLILRNSSPSIFRCKQQRSKRGSRQHYGSRRRRPPSRRWPSA